MFTIKFNLIEGEMTPKAIHPNAIKVQYRNTIFPVF